MAKTRTKSVINKIIKSAKKRKNIVIIVVFAIFGAFLYVYLQTPKEMQHQSQSSQPPNCNTIVSNSRVTWSDNPKLTFDILSDTKNYCTGSRVPDATRYVYFVTLAKVGFNGGDVSMGAKDTAFNNAKIAKSIYDSMSETERESIVDGANVSSDLFIILKHKSTKKSL